MKKFFTEIIAVWALVILTGCVGGAKPVYGLEGLDLAIREASDYLNTKIPKDSKTVFLNIKSDYPDLSEYILSDLSANAVNDGVFSVVDRAQLDEIRAELNFQLSGDVSDESAQSIGQMLGAQSIVSGTVSRIASLYRLEVKAIEVQTARVQGQWRRNLSPDATIVALTENTASPGGAAAPSSGGKTAGGRTASPAPVTQGPADGTYTFWPRVQAFQGARAVSVYLDRIVVLRGYMTIYIYATPEGNGGYTERLNGNWENASLKDMDSGRPMRLVQAVNKAGVVYGSVTMCDLTFQNVTGTRLTLASADNPPIEFYDIALEQPDN